MTRFPRQAAIVAVLCTLGIPAWAQIGAVQDEHDRQIKADTERNTKYHNNADDYPVNRPAPPPAANTGANYVPTLNQPYKRLYEPNIETDADHTFIRAQQHYLAGENKVEAAFQLAQCYYSGVGTPVNKPYAYMYWNEIAGRNPQALFLSSVMRYEGDGVEKNGGTGLEGIQHAARADNPEAVAWLAEHKFRPVLRPALYGATKTDFDAATKMIYGRGAEKNLEEAAKLVRARAEEGYPWAKLYLGLMRVAGAGMEQDNAEAYRAFYEAADTLTVAPSESSALAAARELGMAFWSGGSLGLTENDEKARYYLSHVAKFGDARANFRFGEASAQATHGFPYDMARAVEYYTVAAKDDDTPTSAEYAAKAAAQLANLYFRGEGIAQDFVKSAAFARQAIKQGNGDGMVTLAHLTRAGVGGLEKDPAKSLEWMKAAAAQGCADARAALAQGFDGTLKITETGLPLSSAQRAAQNAVVALPPLLERTPAVFRRAYASNRKYSPAEIADLETVPAALEKAYAIKDPKKSAKAIEAVNLKKIVQLGVAYAHGDGVAVDYDKASHLLSSAGMYNVKAVPSALESEAWSILLGSIVGKGDWQGNPRVSKAIGDFRINAIYAHNTPTPMSNYLMAIAETWDAQREPMRNYLVAAADGGVTDAQIELAYMMWAGTGGPVDRAGGLRYMEMAAKTDPNGMYALGAVLEHGLNGMPVDTPRALELYRAAAAQGQENAQQALAKVQKTLAQ